MDGQVSGQTPAFSGLLNIVNNNSNVGIYDIELGAVTLIDNGSFIASNYSLAYSTTEYTINKKENNSCIWS